MTNKIQYISHLLLYSKYRIITNFIVYSVIYLIINDVQITNCMTEGSDLPEIAEAKEPARPSHQVLALKNEIEKFAGSQADLLEQISKQSEIIEEQKREIETKQNIARLGHEILIHQIAENIRLEDAIENSIREKTLEYKQQITLLKERIRYLTTKTEIDQALLEELRRDKEKLYEKLMRK